MDASRAVFPAPPAPARELASPSACRLVTRNTKVIRLPAATRGLLRWSAILARNANPKERIWSLSHEESLLRDRCPQSHGSLRVLFQFVSAADRIRGRTGGWRDRIRRRDWCRGRERRRQYQ